MGNVDKLRVMGATGHADHERQVDDYYATEPKATEWLCKLESFSPTIWEPACGEGHISKVLIQNNYDVISTDIVNRGFGEVEDFLNPYDNRTNCMDLDIVTNPPYKYALEFAQKALRMITDGHKVALFLKLTFLEGKSRKQFFTENPPKTLWVSSSRLQCGMNGDFSGTSPTAYGWFVWEKGFKGNTTIKWFN